MSKLRDQLLAVAASYAVTRGRSLTRFLGDGNDGALIDFEDSKQIVEMTVVFPPCILDFAKAYVDRPPDFSPEVLRDWREETSELFDSDWDTVESLLHELRSIGIFYFDAKPGNIRFSA